MERDPCCGKLNVKRGIWSAEEDAKILAYVSKHGAENWIAVPKKAGLGRCGKSCRLRWANYLKPDLKLESFTPQEEKLIIRLHEVIGSRWSIIAQQLPGRTDNDVKNYWNTKLRKKLSEMGIDLVTHKPFSQILADYGNIGGVPKSRTRIKPLNRDMKNAFMPKPEHQPPFQVFSNINSHLMTTMVSPKVEPIQDTLLNSHSNSNSSMDLLAQLQAIKLVTEVSNCANNHEPMSPQFFNEGSLPSSSSSSSSSTCSTAGQEKSPVNFTWQDFLHEEEFLSANRQEKEQDNMVEFSSKDFTNHTQNMIPQNKNN